MITKLLCYIASPLFVCLFLCLYRWQDNTNDVLDWKWILKTKIKTTGKKSQSEQLQNDTTITNQDLLTRNLHERKDTD